MLIRILFVKEKIFFLRQNVGIVKVLMDDSEQDDELQRRTPRRVRFGGEVVKMRTPDSDSNGTGDENEAAKAKRYTKSAQNVRSFIPVRISANRKTRSEPNSPQRVNKGQKHNIYISVPDLSKTKHVFGPKIGGVSKIPRRNKAVIHNTIKITIDSNPKQTIVHKSEEKERKEKQPSKPVSNKQDLPNSSSAHQGIEILYNLTQSPQPSRSKKDEDLTEDRTESNSETTANADTILKPVQVSNNSETSANIGVDQGNTKTNFDSFQVCDVHFGGDCKERNASFVPVSDFFEDKRIKSENCNKTNNTNLIEDIIKDLQRQVSIRFVPKCAHCVYRHFDSNVDVN